MKRIIKVISEVESFEEAKELLADLEVLNEKYDVSFQMIKNSRSSIDIVSRSAAKKIDEMIEAGEKRNSKLKTELEALKRNDTNTKQTVREEPTNEERSES